MEGLSHFSAIVYNAALNITIQVFVWTCGFISRGCIPESGILGYMVILCFTFEELPNCFSTALYHFTFPPGVYFLTSFPMILICVSLIASYVAHRFVC